MNLNELPTYTPDIEKLKEDLNSFCEKYVITKFEPEDIVELLEDGETVEWITDQLKSDNAEIDTDNLNKLLTDIKSVVGPEEEEEEELVEEEPVTEQDMPDLSQLDLSQIDMSQLSDMLPPGMQLPPGFDPKQLKKMMDSPQGKFMTDFTVFCQEKGVDVSSGTMDAQVMQELDEEWKSTPRQTFDGKTPAEMLEENPSLMPRKVETYRREEPRVGRNDPCICGSGKKYKKCCGKRK